jgi:peroxiredoxin
MAIRFLDHAEELGSTSAASKGSCTAPVESYFHLRAFFTEIALTTLDLTMPRFPIACGLALLLLSQSLVAHESNEATDIRAGHSHEGEAFNEGPRQFAKPIPGCGEVHFPILSTWPEAQAWFNQGIGQLHGFWYFEAERTFRHIAAHDPQCAMAYWGMAMANFENPTRAAGFIAKAVEHREHANEAGKLHIDAQNTFLTATGQDAVAHRRRLIRDLEAIIHSHPDDIEAKAFLACYIWQFSRRGVPISSHQSVDALLQQVLEQSPMHPAHHYLIHLWDREKAERALASAHILADTAPAIAHMWHMPGHIYSQLHRYDDSAWCQMASARLDHQHMWESRILPDQIHNYVHNQEWLIRNHHLLGNAREATAVAKALLANPRHPTLNSPLNRKSSVHFGRVRLLETLEFFELWDEVLALSECEFSDPDPSDPNHLNYLRLTGIAHFEMGDAIHLAATIEDISRRIATAERENATAVDQARIDAEEQRKDPKATDQAIAAAGRPFTEQIRRLKEIHSELAAHASILEGATGTDFAAIRRPKHAAALLHLRAGDHETALKLSKEAVASTTNQTLPLAARIEVLMQTGDHTAALEAFGRLKLLSAHLDLTAPPFQRLAPIAAEFGEAPDWRVPVSVPADIGARTELALLGPENWTPPAALGFSLPTADGKTLALDDYKGKPVVVLFYLGHGCLHCIEQLNEFAPKRAAFLEAGLEMLAISTDQAGELGKSHQAYSREGSFPFPILADPSLASFKAYHAYDDFEDQALHGTFLIDASGRVLWQDIGAEPFQDPDFLLREALRLMKLHPPELH